MATFRGPNFGTSNSHIIGWVEAIEQSQSIESNTTQLEVKVTFQRTNTGYTTYDASGYIDVTANGETRSHYIGATYKLVNNTPCVYSDEVFTIQHNAEGAKAVDIVVAIRSYQAFSISQQVFPVTLTTIPRATTPTIPGSNPNFTMGSGGTIDLSSRASASFVHELGFTFGSKSVYMGVFADPYVTLVADPSLADQITNSQIGDGTLTCNTYSNGSLVGSKSVGFKLGIPSTMVPSMSSVQTEKQNSNSVIATWNELVKGYSAVKITAAATGNTGSTISSYWFETIKDDVVINAIQQSSNVYTTPILTATGIYKFRVTAVDSRNMQSSPMTSGALAVYDYAPPSITGTDAYRSDSAKVKDIANGTYATAKGTFAISSVNGHNAITKKIRYRRYGSTSWIDGQLNPSNDIYYAIGGGAINKLYTYEVQFYCADSITGDAGAVTLAVLIKAAFVTMNIRPGGKGIGFGAAADADEFQVWMNSLFKAGLTINTGSAAADFVMDSSAGYTRTINFKTAGKLRWRVFTNSGAETGGNAGSVFAIARHDDNGNWLSDSLVIDRSNGAIAMNGDLSLAGYLTVTAPWAMITVNDSQSGRGHGVMMTTNGKYRWYIQTNQVAETGSNVGGNLDFNRYDDNGAWLGAPLTIFRVDGLVYAPWVQVDKIRIGSDGGGQPGMLTLTNVDYAVSSGTGTVKMNGTTSRNSNGFLKMYMGTTPIYVPYWTAI